MPKIKEKFEKVVEISKELIFRFPVTLLIIAITTLFVTFCFDTDMDGDLLQEFMLFLFSFFAGTFFTECFFENNKYRTVSFIVTGTISILFGYFLTNISDLPEFFELLYIGYFLVLMLMGLYCLLIKSKLSFQEYITKVFSNLFFTSIIYGIIAIGVTLVTAIFIELILDGDYDETLLRINLLAFGMVFVNGCVYCVYKVEAKELNLFIKNVIKFVLMPLVCIAMGIIYLYIFKIIFTGEIPSNLIFRICVVLFSFAFPIWNMYESVIKKKNKVANYISYAFLPFIILEIYSLGIRICSLGLTPIRYVGIYFIIFQVIALLLNYFWNKKKLPKLIVCTAILVALLTMTPITPSKVSEWNQLSRLNRYLPEGVKFTELSKQVQGKIVSAYKYIEYNGDSNKIPAHIKNQSEDIWNNEFVEQKTKNLIYYDFVSEERVNVTGYSYVTKFYQSGNAYKGFYQFDSDVESYMISEKDINDYIFSLVYEVNEGEKYNINNPKPYLKVGDKTFYFTDIRVDYDESEKLLDVYGIEGYVLE